MIHLDSGVADTRRFMSYAVFEQTRGREVAVSRGSNGAPKIAQWALIWIRWTLPLTNERKRT